MSRLVCISDTHNYKPPLPSGDILIHAGDMTTFGSVEQIKEFADWFLAQPHKYKVFIAGNHDRLFERNRERAEKFFQKENVFYLEDSGVEIEGVKFWGSPWQPAFMNWAFNLRSYKDLKKRWQLIPDDIDILITHSPPKGFLDHTVRAGKPAGCEMLRREVQGRIKPKVNIFGHIHEGYGITADRNTIFINASTCTLGYQPTNAPIVIDLTEEGAVTIVNEWTS